MRQRKILVIHESAVARGIVRRCILSELVDVQVHQAVNSEEGLDRLRSESFEMVLCANEMSGVSGLGVFEEMRSSSQNMSTPFILLTSSPSSEKIRRFRDSGLLHVLGMPFTSTELAAKINRVCDPRKWRIQDRINIPLLSASFLLGYSTTVNASVVNVSIGGMLCDLPFFDEFSVFFKGSGIALLFPPDYGSARVEVHGELLRLSVLSWDQNRIPDLVRTAWRFDVVSEKSRRILDELLHEAAAGAVLTA